MERRAREDGSLTDLLDGATLSGRDFDRVVAGDADWNIIAANWHRGAEAARAGKVAVSIRLDAELVAYFRESGPGWQTRVNAILRAYVRTKTTPAER